MIRALIIAFFGMVGAYSATSQSITGRITDRETGEALIGATVEIVGAEEGGITDATGYFSIELKEPGVYGLKANFLGYSEAVIPEVWVRSKSPVYLGFELTPNVNELGELVVTDRGEISTPGKLIITEEQINRFASTYYDPARMATTIPDVAVTNDQNNRISVRGISPNYNSWRLEGAEILNPNHLSNAGTFPDQPTSTGGGVNMLSAQMMNQSSFLYGGMSSQFGNTVGGLFDMGMKTGNNLGHQYVAQASFIGFDFAADGPLSKLKRATYAVNYRYSFTGLLTALGADFGGERIAFQDLSFSLNFPFGHQTNLKLFGIGGLSFNKFEGAGKSQAKTEKDLYNIDFENGTGVLGASFSSDFKKWRLKNTSCLSILNTYHKQQSTLSVEDLNRTNQRNYLISNNLKFYQRSEKFVSGITSNLYIFNSNIITSYQYYQYALTSESRKIFSKILVTPYFSNEISTQDRKISLGVSFPSANGNLSFPDIRSSFSSISDEGILTFSLGQYTQLYTPFNYNFNSDITPNPIFPESIYANQYKTMSPKYPKIQKDFIKSYRAILDYTTKRSSADISWSFYYYFFPEIIGSRSFQTRSKVSTSGVLGYSINAEKSFNNSFYYRIGGTAYTSKAGQNRGQFYDINYNVSGMIGNKWQLPEDRSFLINFRSLISLGSNFNYELTSVIYQRFDVRVQWSKVKSRMTRSISIDIQNFTATKNFSNRYFDKVQNREVILYQLGLIPIVTYRLDF